MNQAVNRSPGRQDISALGRHGEGKASLRPMLDGCEKRRASFSLKLTRARSSSGSAKRFYGAYLVFIGSTLVSVHDYNWIDANPAAIDNPERSSAAVKNSNFFPT